MRFLQLMAYLIEQPAIAALPCLFFLGLYLASRKRLVLFVSLLWACYVPYEFGMKFRILCSGECNIRLDLLLIYPALTLLSLTAMILAIRAISRDRQHGDQV